jgi:selenocysteine lyase/cysteine desulfurase
MWRDERIVVKLLAEPGLDAIRISFWALHTDDDIDRVAAGFARTLTAKAAR